METLEGKAGISVPVIVQKIGSTISSAMGYAEKMLVGSYMDVSASKAYECGTCNSCGSGDCGSCCGSSCDGAE